MNGRSVHAVVVAYHGSAALARCLAGLEGQLAVTVIDNSSAQDVAAVAQDHGALYIDAGSNLGFAAAVNMALARLAGEDADVLLLNPDAVVTSTAVQELARFLHSSASDRLAAVAPRLQRPNGQEQRVTWPFPTPARMWAEAIGLGRLPARRTFLVGAVLLLRKEAIADVGPFDERFFLYAEEADWQRRAAECGWRSTACTAVVAEHEGAGSSTSDPRREALFHAAQELYVRKWYGPSGWWSYRIAACFAAAARAVMLSGERRRGAVRRMKLYLRGPSRCSAVGSE